MQFQFEEFVKNQQLFSPNERVLLAVSGGLDSVVMTHLFACAGFDFGIAHVNFKLRGEASEGDAFFVQSLANDFQVPFFEKHFDTKNYAKAAKISTQMAARTLRYAWFEEIALTQGFDKIATAHHLNDALETVLLNLTKGTGLAGLKGISPKNGRIVRPLLFATRADIENYAAQHQLAWREDASNQENTYQRNFIRLEVIPLLQKINPDLAHTFQHTAERLSLAYGALNEQFEALEQQVVTKKEEGYVSLDIKALEGKSSAVLFLEHILKKYGFHYAQTKQIWENRHNLSGKSFLSASHQLYKDRSTFMVVARSHQVPAVSHWVDAQQKTLELEDQWLRFDLFEKPSDFAFSKEANVLNIDADLITFPLEIRTWQEGDYFYPLGMKGKKKISDFLIDMKVPLALKKNIKVVNSKANIVGVIGFRLDERYKITSSTKNIYLVEQLKKPYDKSI